MSTKATIAHGDNFHFYHEVLDDDHVYLRMQTTQYEAGYGSVTVQIPIHIWETIRHLGGARLDLVDKTDADLLATVQADVDSRIVDYQKALRERPDRASWFRLLGCLPYGGADSPREEQIEKGMEYFRHERQHQREIKAAILALQEAQRSGT